MRSGATSSRQPRRRVIAIGLVLMAGIVAAGAVVVVPLIERDLDRRITRSLADAGASGVHLSVRVQDGAYRTSTLALWLAGVGAAALVGLFVGLALGRLRRRREAVDPDHAALLRQGWQLEPLVAAPAPPPPVVTPPPPAPVVAPEPVAVPAPVAVPEPVDDVRIEVPALLGAEPAGNGERVPVADPRRAPAPVEPSIEPDDLTVISGIDRDVATVLRHHGIATWARLGDTEVGELRRMLDQAGPMFHRCQPGTWPIQARLLAEGEWAAWRHLADGLRDGRPIWR